MRLIPLLFALLVLPAAPAAAQQTIRPGQTVTGELAEGDRTDGEGVFYDVWRFRAPDDGEYLIDLRSDDFDPMLRVGARSGGDRCRVCFDDDDGGEGLNARMVFIADAGEDYVINVLSYQPARGGYSLSLEWLPDGSTDTVVTTTDTTFMVPMDTTIMVTTDSTVVMDTTLYASVVPFPSLAAGEAMEGTLDEGDAYEDGGYVDTYDYEGGGGETVTLTLSSRDFDTHVAVGQWTYDGTWRELGSDDDGGEGTDSRLTVTLPTGDRYQVRVRGFAGDARGDYTLLLESYGAPQQATAMDTVVSTLRAIRYGERVEGTLDTREDNSADGRYFDVYSFHGRAGETVTVSLRSDDFDAYLFIALARTGEKVVTDDDGGSGTDSEVTFTLPESGEYLIRATSLAPNEEGAYVLTLDRG